MLAPGTAILRYVVESPIGSGGMGAVYRARDTHLDRPVALKVLSGGAGGMPDTEARERLVREARAAAALSHPNAVAIYDAGDSEHGPFIVMELIEGATLREAVDRGASVTEILEWMKMAARALGEAHDRGIVHRDIKPENLMVRRDGIAKVLDFGIARSQSHSPPSSGEGFDASAPTQPALPTLTGTGVQIGTPQFMAPEQIKGKKVDGRTDQFSWAVTAYEALAGHSPWNVDSGALGVVAAILEDEPERVDAVREGIAPHVGAAIAKAMSKRPEDRFATMQELIFALEGRPFAEPAKAPEPVRAPSRVGDGQKPKPNETRFSEGTMKAVIGKALAFEERGGYSRSELEEAARELGISSDALEEATSAIKSERTKAIAVEADDAVRRRIIEKRRRGFFKHLVVYAGINLMLLAISLQKGEDKIAPVLITAIAWGIAVALHAMKAFSNHVDDGDVRRVVAREERALAKDAARRAALTKRLEKQARRDAMKRGAAELGVAVEDGVATMLTAAARKIEEGAAKARAAEARVRVGVAAKPDTMKSTDSSILREAEAEAEAAARGEMRAQPKRG